MADQNFQRFILAIIIVGVVLVVGIFISAELQDTMKDDASSSVTNETLTTVTEAGEYLTVSGYDNVACSIVIVTNSSTDAEVINSGNYTQTNCNLAFTGLSVSEYNNTDWNVTYTETHKDSTASSNASGDIVSALAGGSAWITILVVVGFAVIVLGMLTSGLGRAAMGSAEPTEAAYTY